MTTDHIKHFSTSLGRDMEYKIYGDGPQSVLVFPSQDGRYYDYENFGMINILAPFIDSGRIRVICVDSIDGETWSNTGADPRHRISLHEKWYNYIIDELIPAIKRGNETFITTGCSMGGFHAANVFFRRPDIFSSLLSLSGFYCANYFFGSYSDELVYANSPEDFLRGMPGHHPYWETYRNRKIICCVGQGNWEQDLLESTRRLDTILAEHGVPHWCDYWGFDSHHDWDWWRRQLAYFMPFILE